MGAAVLRFVVLGLVWWILVEGDLRHPLLALAIIGLATASSLALLPGGRSLDLVGVGRLIPFFLRQSVLGGVDVLRRVVHPRLPLRPGFVDLPLRVSGEGARALVASITSLLPGTLSVELHDDRMRVHTLDTRMPLDEVVHELDRHVGRTFAQESSRDRS